MSVEWADRVFVPDQQVADSAAMAWSWLVPGSWRIIYCSMFGTIFIEKESGEICALECASGIVEHAANSEAELHAFLGGECAGGLPPLGDPVSMLVHGRI